jgi:hypothetical protein
VADLCDQLWSLTGMRGSLALLGKLPHERQRASALQSPIEIDELEAAASLHALQQLNGRELLNWRASSSMSARRTTSCTGSVAARSCSAGR